LANDGSKETYGHAPGFRSNVSKVLGLGLVSAASAVAGGLAVAWWYRKTLTKLQNPIVSANFDVAESSKFDNESAGAETFPLESQD